MGTSFIAYVYSFEPNAIELLTCIGELHMGVDGPYMIYYA